MALKFKITKSAYEKLSDEMKAEYVAGDKDGEFILDVSGLPEAEDVGPLKRANERLKEDVKKLKETNADLSDKIENAPDVAKLTETHKAETAKLSKFVDSALRDAKAMEIATKHSTAPKLLAPEIAKRLQVDMSGDEPKLVILGKDGKPDAALDFEKLSQEFVANPDYKAIIIRSMATGGGAPNGKLTPSGGGAPAGSSEKPADFATMPGKDFAAHLTALKEAAAN